jgi:hypothetical protein
VQAAELQKEGWTIVDVRVADKYDKEHIEGSVSIPLFRPVQGDSMMDNVKRFVRDSFPCAACVCDCEQQLERHSNEVLSRCGKMQCVESATHQQIYVTRCQYMHVEKAQTG